MVQWASRHRVTAVGTVRTVLSRVSGCREVTCRDHHVSRDWDDLRCWDTGNE